MNKNNKLIKLLILIVITITLVSCGKSKKQEVMLEFISGDQKTTRTVEAGDQLPSYTPDQKEGYIFDGFYLDADFKTPVPDDYIVSEGVKIYIKYREMNDYDRVVEDLNALNIPNIATADLELATFGKNGSRFRWISSDPKYITNDGIVNFAGVNTGGQMVTLSVRATYNDEEIHRDIKVKVPELEAVQFLEKQSFEFKALPGDYYVTSGTLDLYKTQYEQVYYVDIEAFLETLNGAVDSITNITTKVDEKTNQTSKVHRYMEYIETNQGLTVRFHIKEFIDDVLTDTESYDLAFDFINNTVKSENTDFFNVIGSKTITEYDDGLIYGEYETKDGHEVLIHLNDYRMDINTLKEGEDTKYLIPLNLANLLFLSQVYYNVYFNQEIIYGVGTMEVNNPAVLTQIKTTSFNTKEMSKDIKRFTYDYLALTMDYFYGVDDSVHGYNNEKSYYDLLSRYAQRFYGDDTTHYQVMNDFILRLDDLHTSLLSSGFFEENFRPEFQFTDLRSRTKSYYEAYFSVERYQTSLPEIRYTDNRETAVIRLDSFEVDSREELEKNIIEAQKEPNLKNIVIDITGNGGGNLGSVFKVLSLMTEKPLYYQGYNALDGSGYSQEITSDYQKYTTVNYYILQSEVTFSAANLFSSIAQHHKIAPILGIKSGGGASSIGLVITPTGDLFYMSSYNVLARKTGDDYQSIEYGITPDVVFSSIRSLYDLINIQQAIDELQLTTYYEKTMIPSSFFLY